MAKNIGGALKVFAEIVEKATPDQQAAALRLIGQIERDILGTTGGLMGEGLMGGSVLGEGDCPNCPPNTICEEGVCIPIGGGG